MDPDAETVDLQFNETRLLDESGFTEDPEASAQAAADTMRDMALLISTAASASEVANALRVDEPRVDQRRIARTLWALDHDGAWYFPPCSSRSILRPACPTSRFRARAESFQRFRVMYTRWRSRYSFALHTPTCR
jgi:hypothetical protein